MNIASTRMEIPSLEAREAARRARRDKAASGFFIHVALLSAICLQRFGISVGDGAIYLSLPVMVLLTFWAFMSGYGEGRPRIIALYGAFVAVALASTTFALISPDARFGNSLLSLGAILVSYACFLIRPSPRFDRSRVLPLFLAYVRISAVLGIVQYLAQFVGIQIFSFTTAMPALEPILVERLFNSAPIVEYGSTVMRSNGFFMVEPSTFSQLLAVAVAVDFMLFRRIAWLPLYGLAYLFTNSGTGLMVLALGLALYAMIDWRQLQKLSGLVVLGVLLAMIAVFVLPEQIEMMTSRADEINSPRSSAYARYIAQFDLIRLYAGEARALIGWGPGAMERADGFVPGSGNPSLKLFLDYGIIGLSLFWAFLISATWNRRMMLVPMLFLVQFQMGGGSLLFSPLLLLIMLLCIWSDPPATARERVAMS